MEPTLMVIGLNHQTAPLAMRERFWVGKNRRYEVLQQLKRAEGIEEVVVLSTCCRTEFLIWASEPTQAANSLLQFLGSEYGLKLTEWRHFYRLLGEAALTHIFRVASGLDCMALAEPQIVDHVNSALEQSRTVGASGRFLGRVLQKAFEVAQTVHDGTISNAKISIPTAALKLCRQIFGTLSGRRVLLLGAGEMSDSFAQGMVESGGGPCVVIDQSPNRAAEVAQKLAGTVATIADRWKCLLNADIVVCATGCPHVVLTHEEAERIAAERNHVALIIMDFGMPRDVDPEVRRVDGILLYDLEGLERATRRNVLGTSSAEEAEAMVSAKVQAFHDTMQADRLVPTVLALRQRLEQLCRQDLESFLEGRGPFTREHIQSLHAIQTQVIQKIASFLDRELKELPEKGEQAQLTAAVMRLFHLESPQQALAGTRLEREQHDRNKSRAVAINS